MVAAATSLGGGDIRGTLPHSPYFPVPGSTFSSFLCCEWKEVKGDLLGLLCLHPHHGYLVRLWLTLLVLMLGSSFEDVVQLLIEWAGGRLIARLVVAQHSFVCQTKALCLLMAFLTCSDMALSCIASATSS